ncbi:28S ribosomal protein S18c, mitochondrial [Orchesella cincta]|uniref:28S ribosomal protein S18c, mitochondrial n=1 Tax=Orchesella cincta TaxID=48709 RepID=A0A1D2MSQ1_ORCCI|nr:28S ribosomal protein S18c, mitochondrial [Orchesella cincta]
MMPIVRTLARSRSMFSLSASVVNPAFSSSIIRSNYIPVRGIKTTDTMHPDPVYDEDEKVLKKVLEERQQQCEDLPIGMDNPYEKPKKICILCEHGITPNYKNIKLLYQFVSPYTGMPYERHITGLCKQKQEQVEKAILLAVNLGLMSNYLKEVEFLKDPKLCDPERPFRPHKY